MRLPTGLTRLAGAALLACAVQLPLLSSAFAGPADDLCPMLGTRGVVPHDFPVEACVDGENIWLRNDLDVPLTLLVGGDVGEAVTVSIDQSVAALATRAINGDPLVLMPTDVLRIPIGSGEVSVTIGGAQSAVIYAIAETLTDFLPANVPSQTMESLTGLIVDLDDIYGQQSRCLVGENWISQRNCDVLFIRSISIAVGEAGISAFGGSVVSLLSSTESWASYVSSQPGQLRQLFAGELTIRQAPLVFAGSPTWDQIAGASIPSLCGHDPTTLINGADQSVPAGRGFLALQQQTLVIDLTPSGDVSAVVASCSAGGVAWPNLIIFFGPGGNYVASTFLDEWDWSGMALDSPAREGVQSIKRVDDGLEVSLLVLRPREAACCPSASVVLRLALVDGQPRIDRVEPVNPITGTNPVEEATSPDPLALVDVIQRFQAAWTATDWVAMAEVADPSVVQFVQESSTPGGQALFTNNLDTCFPRPGDAIACEVAYDSGQGGYLSLFLLILQGDRIVEILPVGDAG